MKKKILCFGVPFLLLSFQLLPMTVMQEAQSPAYLPVTTALFISSAIIFYPATFLSLTLGFAPLSLGYWALSIVLAGVYGMALDWIFRRF